MEELPSHTRYATERVLEQLEVVESQIGLFEQRTREVFSKTAELELVMSLPGVGFILGVVIVLEVGDVRRFPTASHLASYAGTTPRVHSSGGRTRYGQLREDVNRYLKWAYVEAANAVCLQRRVSPHRHVSHLYDWIAHSKGHQKAIGAVARHLSEATYWMLRKRQSYQEPRRTVPVSSTEA